jgi:hypothetical protein
MPDENWRDDGIQSAPQPEEIDPAVVRYLRRLVTALAATMIVGFVILVAVFVIRLQVPQPSAAVLDGLPETIILPQGARATAFTQGPGWFAVVTEDEHILIYDRDTSALRQIVQVNR